MICYIPYVRSYVHTYLHIKNSILVLSFTSPFSIPIRTSTLAEPVRSDRLPAGETEAVRRHRRVCGIRETAARGRREGVVAPHLREHLQAARD